MLWTYFFGVLFVSVSFAQLSDDQRKLVLQLHNQIRSDVARGLALNKNDSALPTGSNIFRLTYSRLVEKLAVAKAKTCEFKHTYVNNTCNNLYLYAANDVFQSIEEALKSSTDAWYNELHTKGLPSLFTGQRNLNHFTELVWHDVLEIGCAIQNCTTMKGIKKTNENHFTFVVCDYSPGGNFIDDYIYKEGAPCSDCSEYKKSECNKSTGLCFIKDKPDIHD